MTIDLKPEQQRVIELAVRSGAYQYWIRLSRSSASNSIWKIGCLGNGRKWLPTLQWALLKLSGASWSKGMRS
jgi:hypothetical protein